MDAHSLKPGLVLVAPSSAADEDSKKNNLKQDEGDGGEDTKEDAQGKHRQKSTYGKTMDGTGSQIPVQRDCLLISNCKEKFSELIGSHCFGSNKCSLQDPQDA